MDWDTVTGHTITGRTVNLVDAENNIIGNVEIGTIINYYINSHK